MAAENDIILQAALSAMAEAKAKAGGTTELARAIGVRPQAVSQWRRCPLPRVFEIERLTGISRHKLRPDFFGLEENAA